MNPPIEVFIQRYAASAARMDWITESRYRELTGEGVHEARQRINTAALWPNEYKQRLTDLLDTLERDTPPHIAESNFTAFRLHPVCGKPTAQGYEISIGGETRARLQIPNDDVIRAILKQWGCNTPMPAWEVQHFNSDEILR